MDSIKSRSLIESFPTDGYGRLFEKMNNEIEGYLAWKGTYATRACNNYRIWLERFNDKAQKTIEEINISDIIKFNSYLKTRFQPTTVQYATIILKNFFEFHKLQGIACISPSIIKVPRATACSYQPIIKDECLKLLSAIDTSSFVGLQRSIMVRILYETGIRVSELTDLNISSINILNKSAIISTKKTTQKRRIMWGSETNSLLSDFIKIRKNINTNPALFVGTKAGGEVSNRITTRSVQRTIKLLCEKAGIVSKITPHSFRHGKAHRILEAGGNPKDVQAILGHVNPISSFVYLQWNDMEFEKRARMFVEN